jgi:SAM-dependent methyltransferase
MKPFNFSREKQLNMLPHWISRRIEVNKYETLRLLEQAQRQIPSGARVLDAGSGEGRYRHYFSHSRYVGLDLAIGDAAWDYSGVDVNGDLCHLPFSNETFDAAVCIQTLEHVNEPMRVTNEIGRVLKQDGRYYLSAPMAWHQHQKPHDYFRYTSYGFEHLLRQSGLRVVEMRPMGGYFWFLSYNLQMLHYWLFPKPKTRGRQLLQAPFKLATQFIFFFVLPLILFYADRLDKTKDHTLGWVCIAEKAFQDERTPTTAE